MALDEIDLWDMDAFQRQEHHGMLEQLRETDPASTGSMKATKAPGSGRNPA